MRNRAGTIVFMAPEALLGVPYDFKADIWSLGVILYALLSARAPFEGDEQTDTETKILTQNLNFED